MSNVYAIRVHDLADDFRRRVVGFCESCDGSYLFVCETDANRVHYQGWIRTDIKPQALRVRLKKAFPECIGNKGYSQSAVKDFDSYTRYILKGTKDSRADVVCYKGLEINEEYLTHEHAAYWERASKPGKSNRNIVEEVHEWAVERRKMHERVSREDLARRVCEIITSQKKALNIFYGRNVVNAVQYLSDYDARQIIIAEMSKI